MITNTALNVDSVLIGVRLMTEEALKQFKEWNESGWSKSETPSSEALILAIQALEKQVEKRGKVFFGGWLDCPNCENDISGFEERPYYCPNCGQKLRWK